MDRRRCTALAVADFAPGPSEIAVDAGGRLRFGRTYSGKGAKALRFWLHFVGMPAHVGALTSPQSMLAPLEVKVPRR
jgi:hypothetical protein